MMPRLDWKPVEKVTQPPLRRKAASSLSSSRCMVSVPLRKREPEQPVPRRESASTAAATTCGWMVSPR